ncbi:hypothetical protein [Bradyrhizobium sp.]|uniref:hypothetical protein n=1 Tax=Bradyrhizobium sp. TaxID=376 RepID=UPI0040381E3C
MSDDEIVGMFEVVEAVEAVIKAADPEKRKALADAIDAYGECFPEEMDWAFSAQSPAFLHQLILAINYACRPEAQSKTRPAIRLVDRKPEGSA